MAAGFSVLFSALGGKSVEQRLKVPFQTSADVSWASWVKDGKVPASTGAFLLLVTPPTPHPPTKPLWLL